jgi:predicted adenylyl cyclase CyaB
MRNLEIKARVTSFRPVRGALRRLPGAAFHARIRQTDWYFRVPSGRLKLRVAGARRDGELIAYLRPDQATARTSEFQRLPAPDAASTRRLLDRMLGSRACVRKRREVWLCRNARIHLDTVEGLGQFIEIEVVVTEGMPQARQLMKALTSVLRMDRESLVARSYGELLGEREEAKREG